MRSLTTSLPNCRFEFGLLNSDSRMHGHAVAAECLAKDTFMLADLVQLGSLCSLRLQPLRCIWPSRLVLRLQLIMLITLILITMLMIGHACTYVS